jgi:hypothetical protein
MSLLHSAVSPTCAGGAKNRGLKYGGGGGDINEDIDAYYSMYKTKLPSFYTAFRKQSAVLGLRLFPLHWSPLYSRYATVTLLKYTNINNIKFVAVEICEIVNRLCDFYTKSPTPNIYIFFCVL